MKETITCLVIDDDPDDHVIFQMAIRQTCLQVNCIFTYDCMDAFQSLKAVNVSIPDFLFIDWNLSAMNGAECLFNLRQLPLANSQVIFYSGCMPYLQNPDEFKNKYFLKKPDTVEEFADELKMILETTKNETDFYLRQK